jgi:hypothetical protein
MTIKVQRQVNFCMFWFYETKKWIRKREKDERKREKRRSFWKEQVRR